MARTKPVNTGYNIINGVSTGSNAAVVDCWLEWKLLSQDTVENLSQVHVLLYAAAQYDAATSWAVAEKFGYVGYNGENKQYQSTTYDFADQAANCFGDYTFSVSHDNDGTKSITLEGAWRTSHSSYISGGSAAGEVSLPTIPRESTVKATDANIGSVSMISVLQKNLNHTHSIAWTFGDLSGFLTATGEVTDQEQRFGVSSIPFTVPESFYLQIPADPYGICTFTCRTYSGENQVGEDITSTCRFTADPQLCRPMVSGAVEDVSDATLLLTGDPQILVRYMSVAQCRIVAQAQNGAEIVQMKIAGQNLPLENDVMLLVDVQSPYVVFQAIDSRGYSAEYTPVDLSMVEYVRLTCNGSFRRTDPTSGNAILEGKGSWFSGSFGTVQNALTLSCSVDNGEFIPVDVAVAENSYQFSATLSGLDYRQSHSVIIRAQDALDTVDVTLRVEKGIPVFDWGENDFAFHVPVYAPGIAVGGIYLTDVDTDPAELLGGVWQQVDTTALRLWKRTH